MTDLQQKLITQSIWLERYQGETPDIIRTNLEKASAKINAIINKTDDFKAIRKVVAEQMQLVYKDYDILLYDDMEKIAETSYNATVNIFNAIAVANSFPTAPKFIDLSKSAKKRILDKNRPILGQTLKDIKANAIFSGEKRLRETIYQGYNEDLTLTQIQRKARAIVGADEMLGRMSRHELDTVVNTALKSSIEESRAEVYNEHDRLIVGWRRIVVFDSRTSPICSSLATKPEHLYYPKPQYTWETVPYKSPLHPNCRTIIIGETRFDKEIQREKAFTYQTGRTVNHRDGTTSTKFKVKEVKKFDANISFDKAFKEMPVDFQKDFLGKKRYELYEKHGAKVIKNLFNLATMEKLTLDELKRKLD